MISMRWFKTGSVLIEKHPQRHASFRSVLGLRLKSANGRMKCKKKEWEQKGDNEDCQTRSSAQGEGGVIHFLE